MRQKEVERGGGGHDRRPAHQAGGIRHSQCPMRSHKDPREEAELVMCDGEMKIHP